MSTYPPPIFQESIFNNINFTDPNSTISYAQAATLFLSKIGSDTAVGNITIKKNLYLSNGLVSAPAYSFTNETNTGLYLAATNDLRIAVNGVDRIQQNSSATRLNQPILLSDGSVSNPAYSFTNQTNTGIYLAATNDLRIAVNGVDRIQQNSSATRLNQPILLSDGSVSNPAYSFASETSLGWYRAGAGDIRLAQLGSDALTYSGAQFLINGRQRTTIAGTASNPAIKIGTDDTNMTGLYNNGIFALTVSVGQQAVADFRNSGGRGIRLYGDTGGNNGAYSPSVLGYYEDTGYISGTFNWGNKTAISNYRFTRIGNQVTMHIQSLLVFTAPSTVQYAVTLVGLPLRFRPSTSVYYGSNLVDDNGTLSLWYSFITSGGDLNIGRPGAGSILPVSVFPTVITWLI